MSPFKSDLNALILRDRAHYLLRLGCFPNDHVDFEKNHAMSVQVVPGVKRAHLPIPSPFPNPFQFREFGRMDRKLYVFSNLFPVETSDDRPLA